MGMAGLRLAASAWLVLIVFAARDGAAYTWVTYNGHEYTRSDYQGPWLNIEAEAVAAGGHLVSINDDAENSWLMTTFKNERTPLGHPIVWIGYYYDASVNDWKWISGEPVTYAREDYLHWPQGGTHAYLHLPDHFLQPGTWNANPYHDSTGSEAPFGIIERVPEPSCAGAVSLAFVTLLRRRPRINKGT